MKVTIANRFIKSLKRIVMKDSWWYKIYSFFKRDLWSFLLNVWNFRKELWEFRWWDYHFTLQMLYRSVSIMEKGMHNGSEDLPSRDKKIQKMQKLIELLDNKIKDRYIELAEQELGYELICNEIIFEEIDKTDKTDQKLYQLVDTDTESEKLSNAAIYDKSRELEDAQWKEIWKILEGQSNKELSNQTLDSTQEKSAESASSKNDWATWFDGTGLRGWWD